MFDVVATVSAERDLAEIHDYLICELCNPQAWNALSEKIQRAYHVLEEQPYAFETCADERLHRKGYRKCVIGSYLFIYRVEAERSTVHIVRFFHGLQDYIAQL